MKKYDNYDYEEAFKKYIDDTEEERLEKLLKEGNSRFKRNVYG